MSRHNRFFRMGISCMSLILWLSFPAMAQTPSDGLGAQVSAPSDPLPLCFVPGTRGGGDYVLYGLPKLLKERNVTFIPMDIGDKGSIQQRAKRLNEIIETKRSQNPTFKCHFLGHSGGGLVLKFWMSHETLKLPNGTRVNPIDVTQTVTLLQAPMKGTDVGFFNRISPFSVQAREQIDFSFIPAFNNPENARTYIYWPQGVPVYNIRTWVESSSELSFPMADLLYKELKKSLCERGMNTKNDGVVSLDNQADGHILFDMRAPHAYFSAPSKVTLSRIDFYTLFYKFIHNVSEESLGELKSSIRSHGVDIQEPENQN